MGARTRWPALARRLLAHASSGASEKSGGRMETVRAKGAVEWLMLCRGFRRPEPLQEKTLHGSLWGRDAVGNHWEKIGGPSENREA